MWTSKTLEVTMTMHYTVFLSVIVWHKLLSGPKWRSAASFELLLLGKNFTCCRLPICFQGDHMQVSISDEEDDEDAEDEFHYEMELGDHQ